MAKGSGKKEGLLVNAPPGKPLVLTVDPSNEPTTIVVWRQRSGKLRIRATRKLGIK